MMEVPVRELRNHTARVLRRVEEGDDVVITVNGIPTAQLTAFTGPTKAFLTRDEFASSRPSVADCDLDLDIRELTDQTTDDLGPIA